MRNVGKWLSRNWVVLGLISIIGLWGYVVWRSGQGWNPSGATWNFTNTGQLGDSFGILSAAMAAIAAFYAFRTYQSAREDTAKLERQAAASSYLNLLERRFDVLDRVRQSSTRYTGAKVTREDLQGQMVLDRLASRIRNFDANQAEAEFHRLSGEPYGLPNLFRFTYHIIAFADRELSQIPPTEPMTKGDPAYQNVRLLRAQISDTELLLIALNCAYGEGREKFKPLVERYAFLHNMDPDDLEQFDIGSLFEPEALGMEPDDRGRSPPNQSLLAPSKSLTEPEPPDVQD